jgi:hypothetical protein
LWSIGRGGLISPFVIQDFPNVAFWISVNGDNGLNNWDYMFESHLRLSGKSESQAKLLVKEYNNGGYIFESGGTFEEYMKRKHMNIVKDI